jgi:HSP20 family protein
MDRQTPFDDIERLFDQLTRQFEPAAGMGGGVAIDVADLGDAFDVTADLPGFDDDDIEVTLPDPRTLQVSGERRSETETEDEDRRFIRRERHEEAVSRTVSLPEPVAEGDAEATYDNGVLTVTLPKATGGDGTNIPVG